MNRPVTTVWFLAPVPDPKTRSPIHRAYAESCAIVRLPDGNVSLQCGEDRVVVVPASNIAAIEYGQEFRQPLNLSPQVPSTSPPPRRTGRA
jgi:hypothetical protein